MQSQSWVSSNTGGGGGGGETVRLVLSAVAPSAPRKTSGAASSATDGVAAVSAADSLLFFRRAVRWLTLDAARVLLARLEGFEAVTVRSFRPAVVETTLFTAVAAATGVDAATSAKDLSSRVGRVTFTATGVAAGGEAAWIVEAGGGRRCDSDNESDYHNEFLENGVRLSTRDPSWERVFPCLKDRCRFCRQQCTPDDMGQCSTCKPITVFQLVKKFGPRGAT